MQTKNSKGSLRTKDYLKEHNRNMLRSLLSSLFWAVISERKRRGTLTSSQLANDMGIDKSSISRWFSSDCQPNWRCNTIADLAYALDLELEIRARERSTGVIFTSFGIVNDVEFNLCIFPTDKSRHVWSYHEYSTGNENVRIVAEAA